MARRKTSKRRYSKNRKYRFILPYPALFFLLLCAGVLLALWTFKAQADNVVVTAKVSANPVSGPAVITAPQDGQHFTSIPITVAGTCPADGSGGYVKVYRNNVFSGVSICDNSNNFSVSSDLFPGQNTVSVQIYNVTDSPGPATAPITVYYVPPQPRPTLNNNPAGTNQPSAMILSTNFQYIGYYIGQTAQWELALSGGVPPYAVNVDWGDGKSTVLSLKSDPTFTISHKYLKPGMQKNHSYSVIITSSDSVGNQSQLQLFVIVNDPSIGPVAASIAGSTDCGNSNFLSCYLTSKNLLKFVWPAYGIVLLMVVSFWLGEREEVALLIRRNRAVKRRS